LGQTRAQSYKENFYSTLIFYFSHWLEKVTLGPGLGLAKASHGSIKACLGFTKAGLGILKASLSLAK